MTFFDAGFLCFLCFVCRNCYRLNCNYSYVYDSAAATRAEQDDKNENRSHIRESNAVRSGVSACSDDTCIDEDGFSGKIIK